MCHIKFSFRICKFNFSNTDRIFLIASIRGEFTRVNDDRKLVAERNWSARYGNEWRRNDGSRYWSSGRRWSVGNPRGGPWGRPRGTQNRIYRSVIIPWLSRSGINTMPRKQGTSTTGTWIYGRLFVGTRRGSRPSVIACRWKWCWIAWRKYRLYSNGILRYNELFANVITEILLPGSRK